MESNIKIKKLLNNEQDRQEALAEVLSERASKLANRFTDKSGANKALRQIVQAVSPHAKFKRREISRFNGILTEDVPSVGLTARDLYDSLVEPLVDLVTGFYQESDQVSALNIFAEYGSTLRSAQLKQIKEILDERKLLLDPSEPFFDVDQIRGTLNEVSRKKSFLSHPSSYLTYSTSGQEDPLLAMTRRKINLEGYAESNDHEPRELD